jgi:hypothetical protein
MKRNFMPALVISTLACIALPAVPVPAQMAGEQISPAQMRPVQMRPGQMVCGKRTDMVQQLGEKYGETRRSLRLAGGRGMVELYASEETGSWTILLTSPQGTACMMAAGEAFQIEPVKAAGNPA